MASSPRELAYKDIFVWELEQVLDTRFATFDNLANRFVFPDMTTQVFLVLSLNQLEWTKLYSAILTGADLTYPDQSHDVEYLFLQTMSADMADLCAAIADCIENSAAVQAALAAYLSAGGYSGGVGDPDAPLPESETGENLLPPGYGCTNDLMFGMANAVVQSIHEATVEVLQKIEVTTNFLELGAELADNIPGVGLLSTGLDVINWIQDTADEQYNLSWSATTKDELACLLFCAFKDDCILSYDVIYNIYLSASGVAPPAEDTLEAWIDWLVAIVFVDDLQTVATVSLLGLIAMRFGGRFAGFVIGVRTLKTVIALAADETDSNWSILCTDCPDEWCHLLDFRGDSQGFINATTPALGTSTGAGWLSTNGLLVVNRTAIDIVKTGIVEAPDLLRVEIDFDLTRGSIVPPNNLVFQLLLNGGAVLTILGNNPIWSDGVFTVTWTGSVSAVNAIRFAANSAIGSFGGSVLAKEMRLYGNGVNPFGASTC